MASNGKTQATQNSVPPIAQLLRSMDPHLALAVIDFYLQRDVFSKEWLRREEVAALRRTRMYAQLADRAQNLGIKVDAEALQARVDAGVRAYDANLQQFLEGIERNFKDLERQSFLPEELKKCTGVDVLLSKTVVNRAVQHAKVLYDQGHYERALRLLNALQKVADDNVEVYLSFLWGKLLCEIRLRHLDEAALTFRFLHHRLLDERPFRQNAHALVLNRVHLIHAALFIYVLPGGKNSEQFVEFLERDQYLSALQVAAPHIARYIAAVLLTAKHHQQYGSLNAKKFSKLLEHRALDYSDPLTQYFRLVLLEYNFADAAALLPTIRDSLAQDYFLHNSADDLIPAAKDFLFSVYTKVFDSVTIAQATQFLGVTPIEAEAWLVQFLRANNLHAKIDEQSVRFVRDEQKYNEYVNAQVRNITPRTNLLVNNLKRTLNK